METTEVIQTLRSAPLGSKVDLGDMVVEVREVRPQYVCGDCAFSTKDRRTNAPGCPYRRACISAYRPDRKPVVFGAE